MPATKINDVIRIANKWDSSRSQKQLFHREAKKFLKELAKVMNLPDGTYEVRNNKAGPGSLGEVILHSDKIYIHLGGLSWVTFYYRCCRGQRDYNGGRNSHMEYEKLADIQEVAKTFNNYILKNFAEWSA